MTALCARTRAIDTLAVMTANIESSVRSPSGRTDFMGVLVDRLEMHSLIVESLIFESLVKILQRSRSIEELVCIDQHATVQFLLDLLPKVTVPALYHLLPQHLPFVVPAWRATFSLAGGRLLGRTLYTTIAAAAASRATRLTVLVVSFTATASLIFGQFQLLLFGVEEAFEEED